MYEEVELDLHKVRLFGWENWKSLSIVEQFISDIKSGDKFPRVDVVRINDLDYCIYPRVRGNWAIEGGHHRAIAHYLARVPLRCRQFDRNERRKLDLTHIPDCSLVIGAREICLVKNYVSGKPHCEYTDSERS